MCRAACAEHAGAGKRLLELLGAVCRATLCLAYLVALPPAASSIEKSFLAIEVVLSFLLVIAMADGRIVRVMFVPFMVLRLGFNLVLG